MSEVAPRSVRRQRRWFLSLAGAAAVFSAGGVAAACFIQSPEQERASASAPAPSVLTAPVERRVLQSTLVTRGAVVASRQIEVTPASVQGASIAIVTSVQTNVGDTVKSGDVVLTVSGRPLIVLAGAVPAYRDLRPGDEGADVAQLQAALRDLSFYRGGDPSGRFGPATKTAVRDLYRHIGFAVPDTGGPGGKADRAAARSADDAVAAAEAIVQSLTAKIAAQSSPVPTTAPGEPSLEDQLRRAEAALSRAKQDRAALIASTGPMMPLAEMAVLPAFPATVTKLSAAVGDPVRAPLISFATGTLAIRARLQPGQAAALKVGMPVQILAEALGRKTTAIVSEIGTVTTQEAGTASETGVPYVPVTMTPQDSPLSSDWNGLDVRVTVIAAQTPGDVLVVPLSAVSAAADGRTTVTVVAPDGRQSRAEVQPGLSGDGFVEVTPIGGRLDPGDRVVVGQ